MTPEQEREAFEAWCKSRYLDPTPAPFGEIWGDRTFKHDFIEAMWTSWQARASLAQPASAPVGWKLVPVEPTPEMLAALWAYRSDSLKDCYCAMLAAAPVAPQPAQPDQSPAEAHGLAELVALELERIANDPPISGNELAQARVLMAAASLREFGLAGGATNVQPKGTAPVAWPSGIDIADEIDSLLPSLGDSSRAAVERWWHDLVARKLSKLAAPTQPPAPAPDDAKRQLNLNDQAVQKRLAAQWGYVQAPAEGDDLPPLPEPWIRDLSATQLESRDHFAADQMRAYALAAIAAHVQPKGTAKPCLVAGDCKHGSWCSEVYCQEHCQFVQAPAPAHDYPHERMDAIAVARYRVVEQASGFWGWGVVAGDGTAVLYKGHKKDCELVAQRLSGAFLDGGFVAGNLLAVQAPAVKAETTGWVCKQCGIDRCKAACPLGHSAALTGQCPMVGIAQAHVPVQNKEQP